MKYMDFRFLVFDSFNGEIGSQIYHGCGRRFDAKPDGRRWHMCRDLTVLESNTGAIDNIKCSRRPRDKDRARRIFEFDKTIAQLVNTLPEFRTYDGCRFAVHTVGESSADCFAEHRHFGAAKR